MTLVSLFFLGTTAWWIALDRSPGAWDDAWYLTNSLILHDTLVENGLIAYWKKFLGTLEFKAPLIVILPTPLYRLFGRSSHVAYGVNLVSMVLLFGAVYRLARRYSDPRGGLVAVYVTATMPLLYGLSRQYLVEYGLTALVAATVCHLAESPWLRNERNACWLGVLCGLGLMMKVTFPLYVFLPLVFSCIQSTDARRSPASYFKARTTQSRPALLMSLLAFASPLALIALPWYARNLSKTFDHAFKSSFTPMADLYGMGNPFSVSVIWRYLTEWVNNGTSGIYFLLLVGLIAIELWCRFATAVPKITTDMNLPLSSSFFKVEGFQGSRLAREGCIYILLWCLPFLVFMLGRNKDIRFTAPLLPAVAISLAWMANPLLTSLKRWGNFSLGVLLAFPLLAYLHTSFSLLGNIRFAWGELVLLAPRLSHAGPPERQPWPHQEILNLLRLHSPFPEERTIMLGSDTLHFNANNFELAVAEGLDSFQIATSAYEEDLPSLLNAVNSKPFFVYKEGGEAGPQFTNRFFKPLLEDVQKSGKFYRWSIIDYLPILPNLPDGGKVVVYQNHYPNSAIIQAYQFDPDSAEPATCTVRFDKQLMLSGLSFIIERNWLKVGYTWRSTGTVDSDLYCFTHILDNQARILGFLDHPIPDLGDTVASRGMVGAGAREVLRYRLPDSVNWVQLRLGLFHKSSGERLKIQEAHGIEGPNLSVADNETAVLAVGMTPLPPMQKRADR